MPNFYIQARTYFRDVTLGNISYKTKYSPSDRKAFKNICKKFQVVFSLKLFQETQCLQFCIGSLPPTEQSV